MASVGFLGPKVENIEALEIERWRRLPSFFANGPLSVQLNERSLLPVSQLPCTKSHDEREGRVHIDTGAPQSIDHVIVKVLRFHACEKVIVLIIIREEHVHVWIISILLSHGLRSVRFWIPVTRLFGLIVNISGITAQWNFGYWARNRRGRKRFSSLRPIKVKIFCANGSFCKLWSLKDMCNILLLWVVVLFVGSINAPATVLAVCFVPPGVDTKLKILSSRTTCRVTSIDSQVAHRDARINFCLL